MPEAYHWRVPRVGKIWLVIADSEACAASDDPQCHGAAPNSMGAVRRTRRLAPPRCQSSKARWRSADHTTHQTPLTLCGDVRRGADQGLLHQQRRRRATRIAYGAERRRAGFRRCRADLPSSTRIASGRSPRACPGNRELREEAATTSLAIDVCVRRRIVHLRGWVPGLEDVDNPKPWPNAVLRVAGADQLESRVVALGQLLFFSTDTGDAWMLEHTSKSGYTLAWVKRPALERVARGLRAAVRPDIRHPQTAGGRLWMPRSTTRRGGPERLAPNGPASNPIDRFR